MRAPWRGDVLHCGGCTLDLEVLRTSKQATFEVSVEKLRELFSLYVFPDCMVSDNGPSFTGRASTVFLACNGIHHIRMASYHPTLNALAERAVKTFN